MASVFDRDALLLGVAVYTAPLLLAVSAAVDYPLFFRWTQEDAWVEWATFASFVIAAFLFARAIKRSASPRPIAERLLLAGLALFCVVVAGEEISWGQRLLGFTPPELFLRENYQQELNLHNLLLSRDHVLVAITAITFGIVGPVLGRRVKWIAAASPPLMLMPLFVAVALVDVMNPVMLSAEGAELALGLGFCASPLSCAARTRALAAASALVAGPLLALLVGLGLGHDEARVGQAERELDLLRLELFQPGVVDEKLRRMRVVHKRVFTAAEEGYLNMRGERFFTDPWGNPYWIHARAGQPTILYSFGPNRRRDIEADEGRRDDILVLVPLDGEIR